jgi:hypothetical protein
MIRQDITHIVTALQGTYVSVGRESWEVYVFDVSRTGGDWFVHVSLVGRRRTLTVTVLVENVPGRKISPRHLLRGVHDWLAAGASTDGGFVDLTEHRA